MLNRSIFHDLPPIAPKSGSAGKVEVEVWPI